MKNRFKIIYAKNTSILLFILFLAVNLYYFINNFYLTFLNKGSNGDEFYESYLYSVSDISIDKIFYTPSQTYVFITSCLDYFINSPKISTRLVSLVSCILLILYFIRRINFVESSFIEKIYKVTLFTCAIFITNQMFVGTSDFLSCVLIVPPFLIIIESLNLGRINLSIRRSILVGALFGLSIATRPTILVLIGAFYITFLILLGIKSMICRENVTITISSLIILSIVNFYPLVEQNRIILDIKEIPEKTGVNWFQRNYLMAKNWDANTIPQTQWISTQEVINFKKENPNFIFPKNQVDLLMKEPGLYIRQMIRMFIKALYSSYRFMYLLFPLLFLSFFRTESLNAINIQSEKNILQNKFIIIFHLISILLFSFLAVKLFEFRWVIPILILYTYFAINYLSKFPEKLRFLVYNFSFFSGIVMYLLHFIKTS